MTLSIELLDITTVKTDCIVNAAHEWLQGGSGVCGAIFRKAGWDDMQAACDKLGRCSTGEAVATPAFALPCKYVIHAVGPVWQGGSHGEEELLYKAYWSSLERVKELDCHSVAFPLISAGIFGYPKKQAWQVAIRACRDFMAKFKEYKMDVVIGVLDPGILAIGENLLE